MNFDKWIKENTFDLSNKTIAITGSTGGINSKMVKILASLNANFIFFNRNKEKTEKQIKELASLYPNVKIEFIPCNLEDFESVKSATNILKERQIDVLYLAAGVYNVKRFKTSIGFNNIFQTNFLSHYYMAKQLLPNIKEVNGKIIAVSSIAHNYSKTNIQDIDFKNQKKNNKVYGNAKRYLTFALQELAKQENFNLSIVHPGLTLTEMTNHYPKGINWLVKLFIGAFCPSVKTASLSLVKGVFENTTYDEWIGPEIFDIWGKPKKNNLKTCSLEESKQIFEIAEKIYKNLK